MGEVVAKRDLRDAMYASGKKWKKFSMIIREALLMFHCT
jgi:hypothetical protein